jgi:hypothetical protein
MSVSKRDLAAGFNQIRTGDDGRYRRPARKIVAAARLFRWRLGDKMGRSLMAFDERSQR